MRIDLQIDDWEARAALKRLAEASGDMRSGVPRTRGDEPATCKSNRLLPLCSPHTRVWTVAVWLPSLQPHLI